MADPTTINTDRRGTRPIRRLAGRTALTVNSTLYECPQSKSATVESLVICNTIASAVAFRLFHTTPTEPAAVATALFYDFSCAANGSTLVEFPLYLNAGEKLVVYAATGSVVTATIYGREA